MMQEIDDKLLRGVGFEMIVTLMCGVNVLWLVISVQDQLPFQMLWGKEQRHRDLSNPQLLSGYM
jgi:hypothetical protein